MVEIVSIKLNSFEFPVPIEINIETLEVTCKMLELPKSAILLQFNQEDYSFLLKEMEYIKYKLIFNYKFNSTINTHNDEDFYAHLKRNNKINFERYPRIYDKIIENISSNYYKNLFFKLYKNDATTSTIFSL